LFYLAYVPTGFIRKYNRVGDYSFGIYIYAFPVQQSIAALIPGVGVLEMLSLATVGAVTMAVLSWHLIEHPSLERKGYCVLRTRLLFESLLARVIRNKR
jgi:peptidoglycan/LPS O-acetylase OafA/YrhL